MKLVSSEQPTKSGAGPTDAALVIAARAGEHWAQQALFMRHAGRILGLSQRMLAGSDEADDLLQDVFVRAFGRLGSLENPQAFSAWLTMLAVRLAQKRLRHQRLLVRLGLRSVEPIDPDGLVMPNAPAEVTIELRAVYTAIRGLPAEQRIALILRRVEGLELQEIADHLRMSLATVKRRLKAAEEHLTRIRERL